MATPNPDRWISGWANANNVVLGGLDCVTDDLIVVTAGSSSAGANQVYPDSANLDFDLIDRMFFTFIHPVAGPLEISLGMFFAFAAGDFSAEVITVNGGPGDDYVFTTAVAYSGVNHDTPFGETAEAEATADTDPLVTINITTDDGFVIAGVACIFDQTLTPGPVTDTIDSVTVSGLATEAQLCQDHLDSSSTPETIEATLGGAADWGMLAVELQPEGTGPPPTGDDPPLDDIYSMIL